MSYTLSPKGQRELEKTRLAGRSEFPPVFPAVAGLARGAGGQTLAAPSVDRGASGATVAG